MFKKGILAIIGTKILFFLKPELNIVIFAIFILLTIYIHSEYINWSEISGNNKYIALSFIIKNILILISSILLLFSIKRSKFKNDGFDKFRDKELKTYSEKKLEPKTNLQKNEIDDAYFDKFRGKKKLRTTQEIKLGKK